MLRPYAGELKTTQIGIVKGVLSRLLPSGFRIKLVDLLSRSGNSPGREMYFGEVGLSIFNWEQIKRGFVQAYLVFILLGVFITACGSVEEKGLKPSEDWSRGVPVGESVGGAVGVYMPNSGESLYLTWPEHTIEKTLLHVVQLDQTGSEIVHQSLDVLPGRLRSPRLTPAAQDRLHMFWIRRPPREDFWELWHTMLDLKGNIMREPNRIPGTCGHISNFTFVTDADGNVDLVCECESPRGLFGVEVSASGTLGELERLSDQGVSPALHQDGSGELHLAWFEENRIQYARFTDFPQTGLVGDTITNLPLGTGTTITGPQIGLSEGWVYLFWSTLNRSGLEAGQARTEFMAFPENNLEAVSVPQRILVLPAEDQPYRAYSGGYSLTGLVQTASVGFNSDYVYEPFTSIGEREELGVALVTKVDFRQDSLVQPAVAVFGEGRLKGYSLAGKTLSFSSDPVLSVDPEGNLHMVWREGTAGDQVYYATTAPDTRAEIDRFTGGDLVTIFLRGGLEGFATSLLFPLALPWLVPGFLLVGIYKLLRDQETLELLISKIILVIGLVAYQVTKVLFIPDMLTYVPFSGWVDIPPGWANLLRAGVPILIFLIGIGVAERFRRNSESALVYYAAVSITDMILTMGVYGVFYLGVF